LVQEQILYDVNIDGIIEWVVWEKIYFAFKSKMALANCSC
jgi:hypothetical protein